MPITNMKALVNEAKGQIKKIKPLPLCHTTMGDTLREMADNGGALEADTSGICTNSEGIFAYYGTAKYIPTDAVKTILRPGFPVALIFDTISLFRKIRLPKKLSPFDSGGRKLYQLSACEDDFYVKEPTLNEIRKCVLKLWGSNENYLNHKLMVVPANYPFASFLKDLHRLYYPADKTKYDTRAFTIEIEYSREKLISAPVALIVPSFISLARGAVKEFRSLWGKGLKVEGYGDVNASEEEFTRKYPEIEKYSMLRQKVTDYINANYLNK